MNALWAYFWPVAALGLLVGAILGTIALRRKRRALLGLGVVVAIGGATLWHGPLGAADRFSARVDATARFVLVDWEMNQVEGRLFRSPLTRRLLLSGPADDFQRSELVRMMSTIPGVSSATWNRGRPGTALIAEAAIIAVAGFLIGLLLAYLAELRRRHNAQWKW